MTRGEADRCGLACNCSSGDAAFQSPAGISQHVAVAHHERISCGEVFADGDELNGHTL